MTENNTNIWGMPAMTPVEFYKLKKAKAGLAEALGGGGGGVRMSMSPLGGRAPIKTSGFGPVNLGGGLMNPAAALHQLNLDRGKYIVKDPATGKFIHQLSTGEAEGQSLAEEIAAAGGYDAWKQLQSTNVSSIFEGFDDPASYVEQGYQEAAGGYDDYDTGPVNVNSYFDAGQTPTNSYSDTIDYTWTPNYSGSGYGGF